MKLCPYCHTAITGLNFDDDIIDYCRECDVVVEGHTVDSKTIIDDDLEDMNEALNKAKTKMQ